MIAALRRLRREALGMNRRNLEFLVPYNPPALFAVVDFKPGTKRRLADAGIPVPATHAELARVWDLRGLAAVVADRPAFVVKPARGAGGGGVVVVTGRSGDRFVKASGAAMTLGDLAAHCSDILAGAYAASGHSDEVLVEYCVQADPVLGAISYRGVPDVRVLVFRGVPVQAMIRLPTRASDGRANLHMGGMASASTCRPAAPRTASCVDGRRRCTRICSAPSGTSSCRSGTPCSRSRPAATMPFRSAISASTWCWTPSSDRSCSS
jgi:alpha-L-glutamate ligase-like protein